MDVKNEKPTKFMQILASAPPKKSLNREATRAVEQENKNLTNLQNRSLLLEEHVMNVTTQGSQIFSNQPKDAGPAKTADVSTARPPGLERKIELFLNSPTLLDGLNFSVSKLRDEFSKKGIPFVFGITNERGVSNAKEVFVIAGTPDFYKTVGREIKRDECITKVFYALPHLNKAHPLGILSDLVKDTHPLMSCFHELNLLVLDEDSRTKARIQKSAAIASLAFKFNFGVKADEGTTKSLFNIIPPEIRTRIFSVVMTEALGRNNTKLAELALPLTYGFKSIDDDGHSALYSAIYPGAEKFLARLIADTKAEDLTALEEARDHALQFNEKASAAVLEERMMLIGRQMEENDENND